MSLLVAGQLTMHSCVVTWLCLWHLSAIAAQQDPDITVPVATILTTTVPPVRTDVLFDLSTTPVNATPSPTPQTRNPQSRRGTTCTQYTGGRFEPVVTGAVAQHVLCLYCLRSHLHDPWGN